MKPNHNLSFDPLLLAFVSLLSSLFCLLHPGA